MAATADIAAAQLLATFSEHLGQASPHTPHTPSKAFRSPPWPLRRVVEESELAPQSDLDSPRDLPASTLNLPVKDVAASPRQLLLPLQPRLIGMNLAFPGVQDTRDQNTTVEIPRKGSEPAKPTPPQVLQSMEGVSESSQSPGLSRPPSSLNQSDDRAASPLGRAHAPLFAPSKLHIVAARTALPGPSLHPVLNLGWGRPLCEVHCNGLTGFFLGGHDRELFIKCTGASHQQLPLVDVAQGGCIMTCSQFEKAAGRELSKKWKESIHVAGEGEGSKATLAAWLRRRAAADFGHKVVGRSVWVCWCSSAQHYRAIVFSYSRESGKHKVRYADGLVEELHLPAEKLHFGDTKPDDMFDPADIGFSTQHAAHGSSTAINRSRSAPACTLLAAAASYQAAAAAGVLQSQCSNVSTSSDYHWIDEPCAATAQPDHSPAQHSSPPELPGSPSPTFPSGGIRRARQSRLASNSPRAVPTASCPASSDDRPVAAKVLRRRRSSLTSQVLPLQTASAGELRSLATGLASYARSCDTEGPQCVRDHPAKKRRTGLPDCPIQSLRQGASGSYDTADTVQIGPRVPLQQEYLVAPHPPVASWQPNNTEPGKEEAATAAAARWSRQDRASPPDLVAAAPLLMAGTEETAPALQSRWMSRVALELEEQLAVRAAQVILAEAATRHEASEPMQAAKNEGYLRGSSRCSMETASPSASFQAMLIQLRLHDELQSYYEAMLQRFEFFSSRSPQQLAVKMVDFIMAMLGASLQAGINAGKADSEPRSTLRCSPDFCAKERHADVPQRQQ